MLQVIIFFLVITNGNGKKYVDNIMDGKKVFIDDATMQAKEEQFWNRELGGSVSHPATKKPIYRIPPTTKAPTAPVRVPPVRSPTFRIPPTISPTSPPPVVTPPPQFRPRPPTKTSNPPCCGPTLRVPPVTARPPVIRIPSPSSNIRVPPVTRPVASPVIRVPPVSAPTLRVPPVTAPIGASPVLRVPPTTTGVSTPTLRVPPTTTGVSAPTLRVPPSTTTGVSAPTLRVPPTSTTDVSDPNLIIFPYSNEITNCGISAEKRTQDLASIITSVSGDQILNDTESPQFKAASWLIQEDIVCPSDEFVIQRYIMAVFYFSTNGDNWNNIYNFLSNDNECNWYGIECDSLEQVNKIKLDGNNLSGSIPSELFELPLAELELSHNRLTGEVSEKIYTRNDLSILHLDNNLLSGNIEAGIGNLIKLVSLKLNDNQFKSRMKRELKDLINLEEALFHNNNFFGSVPSRMCNLFIPRFGKLKILTADCEGEVPKVICECCSTCYF